MQAEAKTFTEAIEIIHDHGFTLGRIIDLPTRFYLHSFERDRRCMGHPFAEVVIEKTDSEIAGGGR